MSVENGGVNVAETSGTVVRNHITDAHSGRIWRRRIGAGAAAVVAATGVLVATGQPAEAVTNDCGIVTCSLYLSRSETRSAVTPSGVVALVTGLLPGYFRFLAIAPGLFAIKAQEAAGKNECLRIRYTVVGNTPAIVGFYSSGNSHCHN
jgi:hypothetical protein